MSSRLTQLTIPLGINELCDFGNFHVGANREVVARLEQIYRSQVFSGFWLWAPAGRGCSHLLQAACQRVEAEGRRALYLPLADLPREPDLLTGMATTDLLAIDDLQLWLGDNDTEAALMGLYQALVGGGSSLLVASSDAPLGLSFALRDLASRMRALEVFEIAPLDESGLRQVLVAAARRKGLVLDAAVLDFWLQRAPRHLPDLLRQLDELDSAALVAMRPITVPLIKEVLKL